MYLYFIPHTGSCITNAISPPKWLSRLFKSLHLLCEWSTPLHPILAWTHHYWESANTLKINIGRNIGLSQCFSLLSGTVLHEVLVALVLLWFSQVAIVAEVVIVWCFIKLLKLFLARGFIWYKPQQYSYCLTIYYLQATRAVSQNKNQKILVSYF